jgi:hypothetical protein
MKGSEAKAMSKLQHLPNSDLQDAAHAAREHSGTNGGRTRVRRLLAEARRRCLPITLMNPQEQAVMQEAQERQREWQNELRQRSEERHLQMKMERLAAEAQERAQNRPVQTSVRGLTPRRFREYLF